MIQVKFILAAGSTVFSRQLAAIFQSEGWQAWSLNNKPSALRFSEEMRDVPHYLVTDKLDDWVIQLSRGLQPLGTKVILSGAMTETPEELESILGVPYHSIMGLPSHVAGVILDKQFRDEDIAGRLFPMPEIKMMDGSVFDKGLQMHLGLDGLVVFRKRGFNPMDAFTSEYLADPSPQLEERTAVWSFDRQPSERLVRQKLGEMLSEVSDKGGHTIGISQIEFRDREGEVIDDRRADEMLLRMVTRYMDGLGSLLPIEKIYIMIDQRCKMPRANGATGMAR